MFRKINLTALIFAVVCLLYLATPEQASAQSEYVIIELGNPLRPGLPAYPTAVNSFGDVVGSLGEHVFIYHNSTLTSFNPYGGWSNVAFGINRHLEIVGSAQVSDFGIFRHHAFFYRDGGARDIFGPGSPDQGFAFAINDAGIVVGQFSGGRGFVYDSASGAMTRLDNDVSPLAISNSGDIAGSVAIPRAYHACVFAHDGSLIDLETLGGENSEATALNGSQHVVGTAQNSAGVWQAFLRISGRTLMDIDTFDSEYSRAQGINDSDVVVGFYGPYPHAVAFRYSAGVMTRLDTLVPASSDWTLSDAKAINNGGQIVGTGIHSGREAGFLMTPTQTIYTISDEVLRRLTAGHIGPVGQGLLYTLHQFGEAIHHNDLGEACSQLGIFNAALKKEIGTGIGAKDAADLFDRTDRMSSWLGCRLPQQ